VATLILDPADGRTRGEQDSEGWKSIERIARVVDISGGGSTLLANALAVAGMPAVGNRHPTLKNLFLTRRSPMDNGDGSVDVTLTYERTGEDEADDPSSESASIEISSSVVEVETNKNASGALLVATYEDEQGNETIWHPTVPKRVPLTTIVYSRKENGSPGNKSRQYSGKVNSGPWSLAYDPAKTWLCTGINGTRIKDNLYNVTYTFEYKENTWDHEVYYHDESGKVPDNVAANGNGYLNAEVYETIDFNGLNL
jgi:hypothetical protein